MLNRILCAFTVLVAFCPALALAQMTPVSGSRGISMSASGGSSYSNSAPFDVHSFNDTRGVGGGGASASARIESSLTPSLWLIEGSATADAMFASPGMSASASSSTNLSMHVEAGTFLDVFCLSGGSYGGFNSSVRVVGGGINIQINGGQNYVIRSESVLVTEPTTISIAASGSGSAFSGSLPRSGYYEVRITATPVPAPSSACALGLVAALKISRRRRVG